MASKLDAGVRPFRGRIGPIQSRATDIVSVYLARSANLVTSGTGVYQIVINTDPGTTNDFAAFASAYGEYRVRGMKISFVPQYVGTLPPGGGAHAMGAGFVSHVGGFAAPANRDAALGAFGARPLTTNRPWSFEWRASDLAEDTFTSTSGGYDFGGIGIYMDNGATSQTYGFVRIEYIVEFRYRK